MPGMAKGFDVNILDTPARNHNALSEFAAAACNDPFTCASPRSPFIRILLVVKLRIQIWRKEAARPRTGCKKLGITSFAARNSVNTNQMWTSEIVFGPEMLKGRT